MDTKSLLIAALNMQRPVSFWYGGHARLFCPHVIGRRNGVERTFGIQFDGMTSQGLVREPLWRCFDLSGMEDGVWLIDRKWVRGESRGPEGNTCIDEVEAIVAPDGRAAGSEGRGPSAGRPRSAEAGTARGAPRIPRPLRR